MKDCIYLIVMENGAAYQEDFEDLYIGFVETEEEAENYCQKIRARMEADKNAYSKLNNTCMNCTKKYVACRECSIDKERRLLEEKWSKYFGCTDYLDMLSVYYIPVDRMTTKKMEF